jgi:hypothetical protein
MTIPAILKYTAIGLLVCILPLLIVGGLGISDNPVGLGLLMVMGTPIVLIAATIAIVARLVLVWTSRVR